MPPTDLNSRIAREVMGWHLDNHYWLKPNGILQFEDNAPNFSKSLDACVMAEAEITRRGLWEKYVIALTDLADGSVWLATHYIRLTPAQRCEAMLAVAK